LILFPFQSSLKRPCWQTNYALVPSATDLLLARAVDDAETGRRLDFYLGLDAALIRQGSPLPILH
jgi:hypothetical protein